ncbi:tetratricopeptide repeat protein [Rhodohalobacter sp.]|uniref:tetratricopeptide repeat protein n=1 Tax=Rhodohalobacter sp. TaxID=1974210 RepID=UPI002ACEA15A|nr:tetratricopeptide repeat protein [Rhodohalobacter sp.]MDZ7755623.1 tetratricopeptide repeat protein [Rhodohalobacter sp.]
MIESNINNELEKKIDRYVGGNLNEEEIDELWSEVIFDDYYYDYMKTVASLKGLADGEKKSNIHFLNRSSTLQWIAAAAIVIIASGLILFNVYDEQQYNVQPINSIELDYYRSAEGVTESTDVSEIIMSVISEANRGNIESAISIVENSLSEISSQEGKAELLATAGSIYYNEGMYLEATEYFERSLDYEIENVIIQEQNYWYLGNAYFQLNRIDEARTTLEKAYQLNGAYSRVAERYIQALASE